MTTTRNMISLALESIGQVHQNYGNQNNQMGVALTMIGNPLNAKALVLELGTSSKGEILELARMCCPSIRVILNVGLSHMENFESLQEVSRAKGELLMEAKPGDICVLNGDDPMVMSIPVPDGVKKGGIYDSWTRAASSTQCLCACAVAVSLGASLPQTGKSLSKFQPVDMRSKLEIAHCGCKIINDCYNANPMSMAAAISLLEEMS